MKVQGGKVGNTRIVLYEKNFRGLHVTKSVDKNSKILAVPLSLAISARDFESSELGKVVVEKKLFDDKWAIYIYPLIYILEELDNPLSKHKPWLDILPDSLDSHPAFFSAEELRWLSGSPVLEQLQLDKQLIANLYNKITQAIPDFAARHSLAKFTMYYYMLCSRFFGLHCYDPRLAFIVAYADLANTDVLERRNATWDCDRAGKYFRLVSVRPIKSGDPVSLALIVDCFVLRP
eukprot:TRINITY_DN5090_c0_g1_i1.p1 TRINITY_DN5090_c0_g1~~TRINITY_DN5090_c0_g1_i1.p1  ORF type:complete len:234 (+),score=43.06 TRINITY_DN5090_c0_g1_i1:476-1177(+)